MDERKAPRYKEVKEFKKQEYLKEKKFAECL